MSLALFSTLHALAPFLALRAVDSLAWGSVIGAFTLLVLRLTRQSAGTRFAMCFSTLVSIAVLPLLLGEWQHRAMVSLGTPRPFILLTDRWALYLLAGWGAIAAWLLAGVARSVVHLRALRRSSHPVDFNRLDAILQATLRSRHAGRRVTVCVSETVRVPTLIGLFQPIIVFPVWTMRELPPAELNQILLHELAHLDRWDDWTNLVQQLVKATFFFHPAVWWMESRVALAREMACDDAVLAVTASPRAYAECLTHLAEKSFVKQSVLLAQAALGRIRQTSVRVAKILSAKGESQDALRLRPAVLLVAACAVCCAVWSARTPQLVGFTGSDRADANRKLPAEFLQTLPPVTAVNLKAHAIPSAIPAKLTTEQESSKTLATNSAAKKSDRGNRSLNPLVHLTAAKTGAGNLGVIPVTQTLLVVTEDPETGSQEVRLYQVQMFRIAVLHPAVPGPSTRIPHKEI